MTMIDSTPPAFDGLHNFRDFGGGLTRDGRRVRRGRLFRSDMLSDLSPADCGRLDPLGIGLVCDLRSRSERDNHPDVWPGHGPVMTLSLDDAESLDTVRPERWQLKLDNPDFDAAAAHLSMADNYRRMPRAYANDIRELLRYLSEQPGRGVLIHCAVGKDRTGFVCGMVQWALGQSWDAILGEYLQTAEQFPAHELLRLRGRVLPHAGDDPRVRGALLTLAGAHPDFLRAAFEEVERVHGTVERYLEDVCDLTPARREALMENLLVSDR